MPDRIPICYTPEKLNTLILQPCRSLPRCSATHQFRHPFISLAVTRSIHTMHSLCMRASIPTASACRTCTVHHLFFLCPSNLIPLYYLEGFDFIPPIYQIHTNTSSLYTDHFFSDRRSASSLYTGSLDSKRSKHPLLLSDASSTHPTCMSLHVALHTVSRSPSLTAPMPIMHRRPRYQSDSLLPSTRGHVDVVTEHWMSAPR